MWNLKYMGLEIWGMIVCYTPSIIKTCHNVHWLIWVLNDKDADEQFIKKNLFKNGKKYNKKGILTGSHSPDKIWFLSCEASGCSNADPPSSTSLSTVLLKHSMLWSRGFIHSDIPLGS